MNDKHAALVWTAYPSTAEVTTSISTTGVLLPPEIDCSSYRGYLQAAFKISGTCTISVSLARPKTSTKLETESVTGYTLRDVSVRRILYTAGSARYYYATFPIDTLGKVQFFLSIETGTATLNRVLYRFLMA